MGLVAILTDPERATTILTMKQPSVIVVMPAYNAGKTLERTYRDLPKDILKEVILVDDHSQDDTVAIAQRLGLKVIVHPQNRGYGGNQKTCYLEALKHDPDVVVMLHPDYQYDSRLVPQLIQPILDGGADLVLGSRMLGGGALAGGMPLYKYLANRFLTFVENLAFRRSLSEYHTGFRAYSRRLLETIPFPLDSDGFVFDSEIIAQTFAFGFKATEIPVPTRYFAEASSVDFKASVVYGLGTLRVVARYLLDRWGLVPCALFRKRLSDVLPDYPISTDGAHTSPATASPILAVNPSRSALEERRYQLARPDTGRTDAALARRILALILVLHVALGTLYNLANPVFEAPDEIWHYLYVRHMAEGNGLPVQGKRHSHILAQQEAGQPPLYYSVAAALTFWVPRGNLEELVRENPHASIGDVYTDGNKNRFVHGQAEVFPWNEDVWGVRLARMVATLFGALTVFLTYLLGCELWPNRRDLAVGAAAINAFIPQFLYIGGAVSNDSTAAATSALVLLLSLRLLTKGPTTRRLAAAAVAVSLAILAKLSGSVALILPVLALIWWHFRQSDRIVHTRLLLRSSMVVSAPILFTTGWWFLRNQILYNELIPLRVFLGLDRLDGNVPSLSEIVSDLPGLWMSFWALFGWFSVLVDPIVYGFFDALAIAALLGLTVALFRQRQRSLLVSPATLMVALWVVAVFVALLRYRMIVLAFQGRLLFPAISAIALLVYLGLACLVPFRLRWASVAVVSAAMLIVAASLPIVALAPAYKSPPVYTRDTIGRPDHPTVAKFGQEIELLGYDISADTVGPGETIVVTLYWHAIQRPQEDYVVYLHLRDWQGRVVAQDDSFPARGAYATSLWSAGEAIRDEVRIHVPADAQVPMRAQLHLGLVNWRSGGIVRPTDRLGQAIGDDLPLEAVRMVSRRIPPLPSATCHNFGGQIELTGFSIEGRTVRPGEALEGRLLFRALSNVAIDYTVFVHLTEKELRGPSSIITQQDRQPYDGAFPTSALRPGDLVDHDFRLVIPPGTAPGEYVLRVGLYDLATGRRLLTNENDHVSLGTVVVVQE